MELHPLTRESVAVKLASERRWRNIQAQLDAELGTEAVEAAMRVAGADPDAYLAQRASMYTAAGW